MSAPAAATAAAVPVAAVRILAGLALGPRALSPLGTPGSRAFAGAVAVAVLALTAFLAAWLGALPQALVPGGVSPWQPLFEPSVTALLLIALGALALAVPLALGMPAGVLGAFAAVGTLTALGATLADAPPWLVLGLLPLLAMAMFFVLTAWALPGSRSFASVALVGAAAALAASGGPVLLGLGVAARTQASPADLGAAVWGDVLLAVAVAAVPLACTWAFASIGALALAGVRLLTALRDALFRVLLAVGAAVSALWLADAVERVWAAASDASPLHGLAPSAGALAALAWMLPVGWAWWRAPRALAALRWSGVIDGRIAAESLLLPVFAVGAALAWAAVVDDIDVLRLGAAWLPACAAYAVARRRSARPLAAPGQPLWLLLPAQPRTDVELLASRAAQAWSAGPVTRLALPEALPEIAGDHVECAVAADALDTLLPTHPAQVDDWAASLSAPWTTLPLRELYAPADLWPHVLDARLPPDALVLLLADRAAPPPQTAAPAVPAAALPRLRAALMRLQARARRGRQAVALPLARSTAPRVDPLAAFEDWLPLAAGEAVDGEALTGWLKAQQHTLPAPLVRQVLITAPAAQAALAERIAARLDGAVDARGFVVEAVALAEAPGGAALTAMLAMPLRSWRLAGRLFGHLLAGTSSGSSWRDRALGLLVRAFGIGRGDFELLELERGDAEAPAPLPELFARAVAGGALARAVLVRLPRRAAAPLPAGYSAQLVLTPGSDLGPQAAGIADHVLALDFVGGAEAVVAEPEPEPAPAAEREAEPAPELVSESGREPAHAPPGAASGRSKNGSPATEEPTAAEGATASTRAEEMAAEGTPAEETPAGETPAERTPAEGTPAEGTPAEGTPAGALHAEVPPAPSACHIGAALLVCAAGLELTLRGDLVRAILLAHLAADTEAPALAQFEVWQRSFRRALANVGYGGGAEGFTDQGVVDIGEADPLIAVERLVLPVAQQQRSQIAGDVLAAAWQQVRWQGFGATANALFGRSMPFGRFVLALADRDGDGVPRLFFATLVQQPDEARTPAPQTPKKAPNIAIESPAFATPSSGRVRRYVQTGAGIIDASLLAAVRDTLLARVAPHYDAMVVELPLDRSQPA